MDTFADNLWWQSTCDRWMNDGFPSQKASNFLAFFVFNLNNSIEKQSSFRLFGTPWYPCDVTVMIHLSNTNVTLNIFLLVFLRCGVYYKGYFMLIPVPFEKDLLTYFWSAGGYVGDQSEAEYKIFIRQYVYSQYRPGLQDPLLPCLLTRVNFNPNFDK